MAEYTQSSDTASRTIAEIDEQVNGRFSNSLVNLADLAMAEWLAATDDEIEKAYQLYRDYYDGEIGFELTDSLKEFFELQGNVSYSYNFIPLAIDVIRERMAIDYFEVDGEGEDTPDDDRQGGEHGRLKSWFNFNRMDAGQDDVHHDMLVDGDAFIIVDWDVKKKMPVIAVQSGYVSTSNDGTGRGVYVAYEEENETQIKFAVYRWRILTGANRGKERLNVYTKDGVYKYISGGGGYEHYIEPTGEEWPVSWVNPKTNEPIGITVIHFDARQSLVKPLISFQDTINKVAVDEMAAADIEGFSMITLSGGARPVDKDGKSTVKVGRGRILYAPEGNWGRLAGGDLGAISMLVDKAIQRLAQRDRIPLKYFQITGQVSSADSQNADDSGLVSLIESIARLAGNDWEDVMDACRRVHNAFCDVGDELEEGQISIKWKSFERVNKGAVEKTQAETNAQKAQTFDALLMNNVSRELAARLAGYDDETSAELAEAERPFLDGSVTQSGASGAVEAAVTGAITDNLETDKGLNGAQINAALDVLGGVVAGTTTSTVAIELLVSVGISRERATKMVTDTKANAAEPTDTTGITQ